MRFAILLLLAGCTTTMVNDNVSNEQAQRDLEECRYQADLATQPIRDVIERSMRKNYLAEDCMKLRGYRAS